LGDILVKKNNATMVFPEKIKRAIELDETILNVLKVRGKLDWQNFTRTQFNMVARVVNKEITREVLLNPELIEFNLVIGKQKLEQEMFRMRCHNLYEYLKLLGNMSDLRLYNWVSGKTLQSYWQGGDCKFIKVNALLVFLKVPMKEWENWQQDGRPATGRITLPAAGFSKSSLQIVKSYYLGNYFLYYQKTDGSKNIIKTPFILKEHESGQVIVKSVSEGHRYSGKVLGIRDGCLYINCQNLDFEEMEQYIFNIGLETKPQVLFGVSNTVSVKTRLAVALRNVLVKQKTDAPGFDAIGETEIPFTRKYATLTEEAILVAYLKQFTNNIITTPSCCSLTDLK
jgi:hypothetical protein